MKSNKYIIFAFKEENIPLKEKIKYTTISNYSASWNKNLNIIKRGVLVM